MKMTDKDGYKIRYLVVPDYVFNNENLTLLAIKIYSFIHGYRAEHFFFSNEKLAEIFGCHEMSISKAISLLVKEKYIETNQISGRKRYITDMWVSLEAYPGSAQRLTLPEANGSAQRLTHTPSKTNEIEAKSDESGVRNKNIFNKNNLAEDFLEIPFPNPKDEDWKEKRNIRKVKKQNGGKMFSQGGFPTRKESFLSRFPKPKVRTVAHGEDIP